MAVRFLKNFLINSIYLKYLDNKMKKHEYLFDFTIIYNVYIHNKLRITYSLTDRKCLANLNFTLLLHKTKEVNFMF